MNRQPTKRGSIAWQNIRQGFEPKEGRQVPTIIEHTER